ncbi:hypothetical protein BHM03_00016729 [Ensete ventricosum]|nr:hypothetical protein BHM03_00016729 [Ensete ventricosum]
MGFGYRVAKAKTEKTRGIEFPWVEFGVDEEQEEEEKPLTRSKESTVTGGTFDLGHRAQMQSLVSSCDKEDLRRKWPWKRWTRQRGEPRCGGEVKRGLVATTQMTQGLTASGTCSIIISFACKEEDGTVILASAAQSALFFSSSSSSSSSSHLVN